MGVSFTVMAHPSRELFATDLRLKLDARIVWDERGDRWDTGRRAWLLHDREATHHAVIQDDAILSRHFKTSLDAALQYVPALSPLVLYAGNVAPYRAQFRRIPRSVSFVRASRIIWGVGIVAPTKLISEMVEYCDQTSTRGLGGNYDLRLSRYFEHRRIPVYYTWPSLLDHRDSPSLVPGRSGGRHAYNFAGDTEPDWTGKVTRIVERTSKHRL